MCKGKHAGVAVLALAVITAGVSWAATLAPSPGEMPADLPAERDAPIRDVLHEWQVANQAIRQAHYTYTRTEVDHTFGQKRVARGEAWVIRPGLLRLDEKDDTGKARRTLLCKGRDVHLFNHESKLEAVYYRSPGRFGFPEQPERYPDGGILELLAGGFIGAVLEQHSLFFGAIPVKKLEAWFAIRVEKEDEWWTYIWLEPRGKREKERWGRVRVVLDRKTYRVRQVWCARPNGSELLWDFESMTVNPSPRLTPESFTAGLPAARERVLMPVSQ
jgi:hypothetical protein